MNGLNLLSATEAARQLTDRRITAVQLLEACLERITAREPVVGAWTQLGLAAARARAKALDAGAVQGLLHGLPLGVKDLMDTVDLPAGYGSPVYANHQPAWDAAAVAMARAAGAVVVGKSVTTEFATFCPGKTANPHNPAHTPGGSSSGSAAAVADFMVPLAFGTQTAGSIIRPAAFCGVVGYKPSFGTASRAGVKALSDTLDTVGALARTVADAALLVAAVSGRRDLLLERPLDRAPRVGLCRTHEWKHAQPATEAAFERARTQLAQAGAKLTDVDLPPQFAGLVQAQLDIMGFELVRSLAYERLNHAAQLSPQLQQMINAGLAVTSERYAAAIALARGCRRALSQVFTAVDVLLAPSAAGEAPAGLAATGDPLFNRIWTLLHAPCVHLPFTTGPQGLPVGLQAIGNIGADRETLAAADWLLTRLRETAKT
jgi:Asp-tRNA(Asn)/Glu-tRNA(Gln) amidotransferase A subunit family amidase